MAKNYIFDIGPHKQSLNESELDLAKKAYLTHDCIEILNNSNVDGSSKLTYVKCKKCNIQYMVFDKYPEFHVLDEKISFNTCEENIIKALLE